MVIVEFSSEDWERVVKIIAQYEKNKLANREAARRKSSSTGTSRRGRKPSEEIKWKIVEAELSFEVSEESEETEASSK